MKDPLSTLQSLTGSTRSEAIVVMVLLGGLLCGYAIDVWTGLAQDPFEQSRMAADIATMLDSIAADTAEPAMPDSVRDTSTSLRSTPKRPGHTGPVNINTASPELLTTIPGIGEKTAMKIVARRKLQRFLTVEDIMDVPGIGQKKFDRMRPFLRVQ